MVRFCEGVQKSLQATEGAVRIPGIRKNEAPALPGEGFQFGFAWIISPDKTRRPSKEKLLRAFVPPF
jgi:hypothetical protein